MDFIYTAIIDRLQSADSLQHFSDCDLGPFKHLDIFKGQYLYPELHLLYKRPALFYQYGVQWTDRGGSLVQDGLVTVRLHIELENYGQSFAHSKNRDYALQVFKYHSLVAGLLHGYGTEYFSPLRRRSNEPDEAPAQTNVHVISFDTKIVDNTAQQIRDTQYTTIMIDNMHTQQVPIQDDPGGVGPYVVE